MKRLIALLLCVVAVSASAQNSTNTVPAHQNDGGVTFAVLVSLEAIAGVCVYFYAKAMINPAITNQYALVTCWRSTNAVNWDILSQDVIPIDSLPHSVGGDSWYYNRALYKIKVRPWDGSWAP